MCLAGFVHVFSLFLQARFLREQDKQVESLVAGLCGTGRDRFGRFYGTAICEEASTLNRGNPDLNRVILFRKASETDFAFPSFGHKTVALCKTTLRFFVEIKGGLQKLSGPWK